MSEQVLGAVSVRIEGDNAPLRNAVGEAKRLSAELEKRGIKVAVTPEMLRGGMATVRANLQAEAGRVPLVVSPTVAGNAAGRLAAEIGRVDVRAVAAGGSGQAMKAALRADVGPLPVVVNLDRGGAQRVKAEIDATFGRAIVQRVVVQQVGGGMAMLPGGAMSGPIGAGRAAAGNGGAMAGAAGLARTGGLAFSAGMILKGVADTIGAYSRGKSLVEAAGDSGELNNDARKQARDGVFSIPIFGTAARRATDATAWAGRWFNPDFMKGQTTGDADAKEFSDRIGKQRNSITKAADEQAAGMARTAKLAAEQDPFNRERMQVDEQLEGMKNAAKEVGNSLRAIARNPYERTNADQVEGKLNAEAATVADTMRASITAREQQTVAQGIANASANVEAEKLRLQGRTYDAEMLLLKRREDQILQTVKGSAEQQVQLAEVKAALEVAAARRADTLARGNFDLDTRERMADARAGGDDAAAGIIADGRAAIRAVMDAPKELQGRLAAVSAKELRTRFDGVDSNAIARDFDPRRQVLQTSGTGTDKAEQTLSDILKQLEKMAEDAKARPGTDTAIG
jgi:hypothetical protein